MATITKRPGRGGKIAFRAEIRRKGYPRQVKTFSLKRDAVNWARKVERLMDKGTWRDQGDADKYLFSNALDKYLKKISINKRPGTQKRDILSASHLKKRLGHLSLAQVTSSKINSYMEKRLQKVSPHSVRIELALLSHLFNKARKDWKMGNLYNPVSDVDKPKLPEGRCPVLSQEQIERLLEGCSNSRSELLLPFVLLALHTGCRSLELRGMRWEQVNLHDGYISLIGEEVKSHRRRTIPLTEPARQVLENLAKEAKKHDEHGNPTGLVFPSTSNPEKPRDMHKAFNQVVRQVGLDHLPGAGKLRIHDLRHCCGSALIMSGVDLETTRKLLGHRDISTTQRYLHVVDSHMRDAISKISHLGINNKEENSK